MVFKIQSETKFCHFSLNEVWLQIKAWWTEFFVILGHFWPFDPPNNPKNQDFESMKKNKIKKKKHLQISFYSSVPHVTVVWCMIPEIWSLTDRIFCHFGLFFAFLPPNNLENQNFEKKKSMELSSFHTFVPKIVIRWCMVLEIWCMTDGRTDKQMDRWRADRQTEKVA